MSVRWQFRYCLLTYSRCGDLDPFHVVDKLSALGAECIVAREHHQNEEIHLHAFADFGRKYRSRDVHAFDVDGRHPNVSSTKVSPQAGFDYACKDGDIVAGGLERPGNTTSGNTDWAKIVAASDADEFWRLCESLAPRALLCNFNSVRSFAEWRYKPLPPKYESPGGISFDTRKFPELDAWVQEHLMHRGIGR